MNKISQTIMESLETINDFHKGIHQGGQCHFGKMKSHLLKSQIKVIEAVIVGIKQALIREPHTVTGEGYNRALKEQISSLNETLEFIKKSL